MEATNCEFLGKGTNTDCMTTGYQECLCGSAVAHVLRRGSEEDRRWENSFGMKAKKTK